MAFKILNFIGFQIGWFACVLGAAAGRPALGPAVVAALAAANLAGQRRRAAELLLWALAAALGYVVDSGLVLLGALEFPPGSRFGGPSPVWMVAMWVNLAMTLNASLSWLRGRYALSAALGASGGPAAYFAGAQLGAVSLGSPPALSLFTVALAWAAAMPALLGAAALARRALEGTGAAETVTAEVRP